MMDIFCCCYQQTYSVISQQGTSETGCPRQCVSVSGCMSMCTRGGLQTQPCQEEPAVPQGPYASKREEPRLPLQYTHGSNESGPSALLWPFRVSWCSETAASSSWGQGSCCFQQMLAAQKVSGQELFLILSSLMCSRNLDQAFTMDTLMVPVQGVGIK